MLRIFWLASLCLAILSLLHAEPIPFEPDPPLPDGTKQAKDAIATFRFPKEFKVELFAAEPMLASPVAISLDEKNRVFVAEEFRFNRGTEENRTRGFLLEDDLRIQTVEDRLKMYQKHAKQFEGGMGWFSKKSDQIRLLEDRSGIGKADHSSVFADGFNDPLDGLAAGLLAHEGELFFTCIPSLWKLKDTKNQGKADVRESVHRGFGVNCAFLGHDLHGLVLGPDGKLYFSVGDRGFHVETKEGKTLHGPRTGGVFRCNLDGSELECIHRGLRNPQELAFDQYGNLFADDNNCDKGDHARLVYILEDGDSGWNMAYQTIPEPYMGGPWFAERLWHLPHPSQPAWIVPCVGKIGAGPSGFVFNGGVSFPDAYRHQFFMCNYTGNGGIETFGTKPKGAGFEMTETKDFLKPIRATDAEFGYDGKMYVSDFVNLDWTGKSAGGRIYTLFDPERIKDERVHEVKQLFAEGFKQRPVAELVKLLEHPDLRVRLRSQYALAERGGEAEKAFAKLLTDSKNQLARIHAIWSIGQLARKKPRLLARIAERLADSDEEIRCQAAKVLNDLPFPEAKEKLLTALTAASSARLQSFAALALGKLKAKEAVKPLFQILAASRDQDPWLRHAVVTGLARIGDAEAVQSFAQDSSPSVRLGVVLVQRKLKDDRVAQFLNDSNLDVATEAARAIHDLPIESKFAELASSLKRFESQATYESEPMIRRALDANLRLRGEANFLIVLSAVKNPVLTPAMRAEALNCLSEWSNPGPRDRVTGFWNPIQKKADTSWIPGVLAKHADELLSKTSGKPQSDVISLLTREKVAVDPKRLIDWVGDHHQPAGTRIAALKFLHATKSTEFPKSLDSALTTGDPRLRAAARDLLIQSDAARGVEAITSILSDAKAATFERQQALESLARWKPADGNTLLDEWAEKLVANEVPVELRLDASEAIRAFPSGKRQALLQKFDAALASAPFGKNQVALSGGDAERGQELFTSHAAAQCVRCHAINGSGGNAGPDLAKLVSRNPENTREHLLQSMLTPDTKVATGFGTVRVVTLDGKVIAGTLQSDTPKGVEVTTPEGQKVFVAKDDIDSQSKPTSAMPSMERTLSPRELRDLVEFLMTLK